jgi:hypothetical protein
MKLKYKITKTNDKDFYLETDAFDASEIDAEYVKKQLNDIKDSIVNEDRTFSEINIELTIVKNEIPTV